jgi:AMP-activated protein kinase-like protein
MNSPCNSSPKLTSVWFEFVDPAAVTVCIAGTFNDWHPERTPMLPWGEGRWLKEIAVSPQAHEYCLVVDGNWIPDPGVKKTVPNPFGGRNSILDLRRN